MELINSILYIDFKEDKPEINFWHPQSLPEDFRRFLSELCFSIISEDQTFFPEVLLIYPIPSTKLKILIKYFKREDKSAKNGFIKSAIVFTFAEANDQIYYRYVSYLDSYFSKFVSEIINLEKNRNENQLINEEIVNLQSTLCDLIDYLHSKIEVVSESEESFEIDADFKIPEKILKNKFKVVVLGDPSVGKTSTILRFTDNIFLRAYIPTMGLNITKKTFNINNSTVELALWDIGGQSKFEPIREQFYEGMSFVLLLFDLTNPISFANAPNWYNDIKSYFEGNQMVRGYLVGNKNDLIKERIISEIDANRLAIALDLEYIEISALTGHNIEKIFNEIANKLLLSGHN